jgi:hypothetical protein
MPLPAARMTFQTGNLTMDFSVKATLGYHVKQDVPFVFNVQAQQFSGQTIVAESLRLDPSCR